MQTFGRINSEEHNLYGVLDEFIMRIAHSEFSPKKRIFSRSFCAQDYTITMPHAIMVSQGEPKRAHKTGIRHVYVGRACIIIK